jgi:hypothetical protein
MKYVEGVEDRFDQWRGCKKVMLHNDQVLAQFKSIDGHATWSVLKMW